MIPRIEILEEKKLVGMHKEMSVQQNLTGLLWKEFSPRIAEIAHRTSADRISLQVYPSSYFQSFNPDTSFEKWAAVEVSIFNDIPQGMDSFIVEKGDYAVFDYKGSSADSSIFQYIFSQWLPNSNYQVDDRPHFEVLGPKYRNNDPSSEEEIWIPIREK